MSEQNVRVRFAPSPTGPLHIGGVRTALYNYLFAKQHGGKFILRIEDTDQTRKVDGAEAYIKESLAWCGIIPDEGIEEGGDYGPYKQSERAQTYRELANKLLDQGKAYYAFDTPEELDALRSAYEADKKTFAYDASIRLSLKNSLTLPQQEVESLILKGTPYVIRFKVEPDQQIQADDLIRGQVTFQSNVVDDKILFKSDGLPTYHLANVVDDHLMKITHVIRGEEWLPSLPLHVMLYQALGWEKDMPKFAHLPLILKPTGKGKLSKRDGDKGGFPVFPINWTTQDGEIFMGYREQSYFPEAVVNMLAFLGWNPGDDNELLSLKELIQSFNISKVQKGGARFDPDKAKWYNQQYLQKQSLDTLAVAVAALAQQEGIQADQERFKKVCEFMRERASFINEIWEQGDFFFKTPTNYDEKMTKKFWKEDTPVIIAAVKSIVKNIEEYSSESLELKIKEYIELNGLGFGKVMNPVRLAMVGSNRGPHLFDILDFLGREEVVVRLDQILREMK